MECNEMNVRLTIKAVDEVVEYETKNDAWATNQTVCHQPNNTLTSHTVAPLLQSFQPLMSFGQTLS